MPPSHYGVPGFVLGLVNSRPMLGTGLVSQAAHRYLDALVIVVSGVTGEPPNDPYDPVSTQWRDVLLNFTVWACRKGVPPDTIRFLATVHFS